MGFWGVWVGSYITKKFDDFIKKLIKVEQCTTFEGKNKIIIQNGVGEKKLCYPINFIFSFEEFGQL
jgi:UDP-N-acetylglucosamine transferase subunit ALG13